MCDIQIKNGTFYNQVSHLNIKHTTRSLWYIEVMTLVIDSKKSYDTN